MKKLFAFCFTLIIGVSLLLAQTPDAFKYQTVVRDNTGKVLTNHLVAFKISVHSGSATGIVVFAERQQLSTNDYGLVNISIGKGTWLAGDKATINWQGGTFFLKVECDMAGGTNYVLMGISQLLSVPFAKYADKAGTSNNDQDTSPTNELQSLTLKTDTLGVTVGNSIVLPRFVPKDNCIMSKNIIPPTAYVYSGDYMIPSNSNTWTAQANIPVAVYGAATALVNNKIYIIGGYNGTTIVKTVYEYDPVANTWASKANLPVVNMDMACEVVNNKIYVIGGWSGSSAYNTVYEYDQLTNSWTTKANMPTSRTEMSSAVVNNKIYVFGGSTTSSVILNIVEVYDPAANSWTTKVNMPTARKMHSSAAVNNKIYVIGGYNGVFLGLTEEYNPATDTWVTMANMTTARGDVAIGVINNKIYVVGGGIASGLKMSINEQYNPATNTWATKASMANVRSAPSGVVFNGCLYVIGGGASTTAPLVYNEKYIPESMYYIHCKQ
jgi:N-acetylneuraminic acid mutarotase